MKTGSALVSRLFLNCDWQLLEQSYAYSQAIPAKTTMKLLFNTTTET
jgi:hypothetical protein